MTRTLSKCSNPCASRKSIITRSALMTHREENDVRARDMAEYMKGIGDKWGKRKHLDSRTTLFEVMVGHVQDLEGLQRELHRHRQVIAEKNKGVEQLDATINHVDHLEKGHSGRRCRYCVSVRVVATAFAVASLVLLFAFAAASRICSILTTTDKSTTHDL